MSKHKIRVGVVAWNKKQCDNELVNTGQAPEPKRRYISFDAELPLLPEGWEVERVTIDEPWVE